MISSPTTLAASRQSADTSPHCREYTTSNIGTSVSAKIVKAEFAEKVIRGENCSMCGTEACDACIDGLMQNITKRKNSGAQIWVCNICGTLQVIGKKSPRDEFTSLIFQGKIDLRDLH